MIKIHYNFPINLQNRTGLWWGNIYQHMLHLLSSTLHGELDLNSLYDLLTSLCIIIRKNSQDLINFIYLYPGWWHFTNMTLHIFNKHLAGPAAAPILVFWEHLHLKHFMIYLWYILDITEILQPDMDVKKYLNLVTFDFISPLSVNNIHMTGFYSLLTSFPRYTHVEIRLKLIKCKNIHRLFYKCEAFYKEHLDWSVRQWYICINTADINCDWLGSIGKCCFF